MRTAIGNCNQKKKNARISQSHCSAKRSSAVPQVTKVRPTRINSLTQLFPHSVVSSHTSTLFKQYCSIYFASTYSTVATQDSSEVESTSRYHTIDMASSAYLLTEYL